MSQHAKKLKCRRGRRTNGNEKRKEYLARGLRRPGHPIPSRFQISARETPTFNPQHTQNHVGSVKAPIPYPPKSRQEYTASTTTNQATPRGRRVCEPGTQRRIGRGKRWSRGNTTGPQNKRARNHTQQKQANKQNAQREKSQRGETNSAARTCVR